MPTFEYQGHTVELVTSIDDIDLDDAEILEDELGIDIRDFDKMPRIRMFKTFALISLRQAGITATMKDVGKITLTGLLQGFSDEPTNDPAREAPPVDAPTRPEAEATVPVSISQVAAPDDALVTDAEEFLSPTSADSSQQRGPLSA